MAKVQLAARPVTLRRGPGEAVRMAAPRGAVRAAPAWLQVCRKAGVGPLDVRYVEAHGTVYFLPQKRPKKTP